MTDSHRIAADYNNVSLSHQLLQIGVDVVSTIGSTEMQDHYNVWRAVSRKIFSCHHQLG